MVAPAQHINMQVQLVISRAMDLPRFIERNWLYYFSKMNGHLIAMNRLSLNKTAGFHFKILYCQYPLLYCMKKKKSVCEYEDGWTYTEKYLDIFLLNLDRTCPDAAIIFLYLCSFIFWTSFFPGSGCEVVLNFPSEKMILNLSIHQAWWLGNLWKRMPNVLTRKLKL